MPALIGIGSTSDPEPKLRTQAETTRKGHAEGRLGPGAPSVLPGRAQSSGIRGVIFTIDLAPTALLRVFSSVLPYSIHGCNLWPNWELLQPGTLYETSLRDIGKSAVGAGYMGKRTLCDHWRARGLARPPEPVGPGPRVVGAFPKRVS